MTAEPAVSYEEFLAAKARLATSSGLDIDPADIARMRTLNMLQERAGRQMHLCPLQFDIVDRCITQYSMPGEIVFDPFAGIGTVPYCAIKLGRRGWGNELNAGYFADAVTYCQMEARKAQVPTLFDLPEAEAS